MNNRRAYLTDDVLEWLLDGSNPSVRLAALVDLLDLSRDDVRVTEARASIMERGVVPLILSGQKPGGFWDDAERFYLSKYRGSVWQLIILAEHGADPDDPRITAACEFLLDRSQDIESHGFSVHTSAREGGGRHSEVIPCLTGNMVFSLIRLGCFGDTRIQKAVSWITDYQRFDDGVAEPPTGWPYDRGEPCWGRHTCFMGVVKALKALAEIPVPERTSEVNRTVSDGVEFLLRHRIYKRSHDSDRESKPGWKRFGFPLMYQTDVLEILDILTSLGVDDGRMRDAIELVISKRMPDGRWRLDSSFNGKFNVDVENKGEASRWITLRALRILKRLSNPADPRDASLL